MVKYGNVISIKPLVIYFRGVQRILGKEGHYYLIGILRPLLHTVKIPVKKNSESLF